MAKKRNGTKCECGRDKSPRKHKCGGCIKEAKAIRKGRAIRANKFKRVPAKTDKMFPGFEIVWAKNRPKIASFPKGFYAIKTMTG